MKLSPFLSLSGWALLASTLGAQAPSWPQHQANAAHNGYVPITLDVNELTYRWSKPIAFNRPLGNPAAADGLIVVHNSSDTERGVYCYDHITGELYWSDDFSAFGATDISNPVIHSGSVVVEATFPPHWGEFYLIDGKLGYQYLAAPIIHAAGNYFAPTIYSNVAYMASSRYDGIAAREIATGLTRWDYDMFQVEENWTPAVDDDNAYMYHAGKLHAFDRVTGALQYLVPDPNWTSNRHDYPTPMLGSIDNVILAEEYRIMSWDRNTGIRMWEHVGDHYEPSAVAGGAIYSHTWDGDLSVNSEIDGSYLWGWTPPNGDQLRGRFALTDSHVIVSSYDNTYAVNLNTRQMDWSYPAGGTLAIGQSNLVIGGWDGILTVIGYRDVPEPVSVSPAQVNYFDPGPTTITISGSGFEDLQTLEVWFGEEEADDLVIVDSSTITCTLPEQGPGVVDVRIENMHGHGSIVGGFAYTPSQELSGIFELGGSVDLSLQFEADSGIGVLFDFGNARPNPIQVNPYIGDFWLESYAVLFEVASWPFGTQLDLNFQIPNNAALQGQFVQVQSAIGPDPRGRNAAFTNLSSFQIQ